jgi:exo-beta-1,3-glucanase (GH17 family)
LVPFIAQNFPHLNIYLGIYESSKWRSATEEQMAKAIELANKYPNIVEYVIVGNECLDQDFAEGSVSVDQLIADINKVKQSVPANVKVTTCLGFHSGLNPEKMQDGSPNSFYRAGNDYGKRIMQQSRADSLMFTVYPFYGKLPVEEGKDNTKYWYDYAVKNIANGKPVILGEVGWPSTADSDPVNGKAVPSVANEQKYTTDMINAAKDGQVGAIFLFEAFDEPWKSGKEEGGNQWEKHWGLWDQNGNPKFPIPKGL